MYSFINGSSAIMSFCRASNRAKDRSVTNQNSSIITAGVCWYNKVIYNNPNMNT